MIKKILLISVMFVIFSVFVSADKAAYIVKSPNRAEQKYIDILENINFTVDVIDDDNLININLPEYSFLLINDDYFSNPGNIPVNEFPSLLLNTYNIDDFHWSSSSGVLASTGILQAYINDPNHFITRNFPTQVGVYINRGLSYYYLPKRYKALGLKTIASLTSDHLDAVIAIAEKGTRLKDNVYSNAKGVFFGIHNHNNWTNYTRKLFENSAIWLATDFITPVISNITVGNITNESAKITWDTDKEGNSAVFYDRNLNLNNIRTDNNFVKKHAILLDNLEGATTYYYKVSSCNRDGYCRNSSIYNFSTLDLSPPHVISQTILDITNSSINISIITNEEVNLTVFYGIDKVSLDDKAVKPSFGAASNVFIDGLSEKTTYFYLAEMCDIYGNCADSSIFNFTTLDLTPPYLISTDIINITNSSVNISIITNEEVNLTVFYGIDKISLDNKAVKPSFGAASNVFIDGLSEKTTYFYLAGMCDIYGNCADSSIFNFTTLDLTPPNPPKNLILEVMNDNRIKIKWAPDGEIAIYNIYIADAVENFDFENPNISTTLNEYTDNSAPPVKQRRYAVRAEDAAGNEEKNENIAAKFDLELKAGYNLVSFPLIPFDADANEVMHQTDSYKPVSEIKRYDTTSQGFKAAGYDDITDQWNTTIELAALEGYFFKSDQALNFTIVGYSPSGISLELVEGMNLIGLALFETKSIEEAIVQSPSGYNITEIAFRSSDGSYKTAAYYPSEDSWFMVNGFDIYTGVGYWVKANKNFSLILNP